MYCVCVCPFHVTMVLKYVNFWPFKAFINCYFLSDGLTTNCLWYYIYILREPNFVDKRTNLGVCVYLFRIIYNVLILILTMGWTVRDRISVATRFSARPDRPWAHPASCTMGTGSFPGVKCGRGALLTTHPFLVPRSWKSTSTHPLGHTEPVTGTLYFTFY